jgi:hypothetical protein
MGKVMHLPPPGPDDPIFAEGFLISGMPKLPGSTESAQTDLGAKASDEDEESKDLDSAD